MQVIENEHWMEPTIYPVFSTDVSQSNFANHPGLPRSPLDKFKLGAFSWDQYFLLLHGPPKYLTSNLSRCFTRFRLALNALQSFFSSHPMPSSSNRCVYANTLASNKAGLSLPKNHLSSPSKTDRASNALSASLYKSSVSIIGVFFNNSSSAALQSCWASEARTSEFEELGMI